MGGGRWVWGGGVIHVQSTLLSLRLYDGHHSLFHVGNILENYILELDDAAFAAKRISTTHLLTFLFATPAAVFLTVEGRSTRGGGATLRGFAMTCKEHICWNDTK